MEPQANRRNAEYPGLLFSFEWVELQVSTSPRCFQSTESQPVTMLQPYLQKLHLGALSVDLCNGSCQWVMLSLECRKALAIAVITPWEAWLVRDTWGPQTGWHRWALFVLFCDPLTRFSFITSRKLGCPFSSMFYARFRSGSSNSGHCTHIIYPGHSCMSFCNFGGIIHCWTVCMASFHSTYLQKNTWWLIIEGPEKQESREKGTKCETE